MKITRIYIDGFGILNNLDIKISQNGVALFHGANESGKTTLMEFIKFILGGPKRKMKFQEVSYQPYNGGKFGGFLEIVTSEGEEYIVERYITATSKAEGQLIVREKNSFGKSKELKEVIGDISLKFYTSIFAFGLDDLLEISSLDHEEVKTRVLNSREGIKAQTLNLAYFNLRSQMEELYKPSGVKPKANLLLSELDFLEKKILELKSAAKIGEDIEYEVKRLKQELNNKSQNLSEIEKSSQWLSKLSEGIFDQFFQKQSQKALKKKDVFLIVGSLICVAVVWMVVLLKGSNIWLGILMTIILFAVSIIGITRSVKARRKSEKDAKKDLKGAVAFASSVEQSLFGEKKNSYIEDIDYLKFIRDKLNTTKSTLEKEINYLQRQLDILEAECKSLNKDEEIRLLSQKFESTKAFLKEQLKDWAVSSVCLNFLKRVHEGQSSRTAPDLIDKASGYLARITEFKYDKILISEEGNFKESLIVNKRGKDFDSRKLSSGTREQMYLVLRLALMEQYNEKFEPLPVLMDDVLVNYDAKRAYKAAALISEIAQKDQIFIFTCHDSIAEYFRDIGKLAIDFHMNLKT